jgi:hypothetical protein
MISILSDTMPDIMSEYMSKKVFCKIQDIHMYLQVINKHGWQNPEPNGGLSGENTYCWWIFQQAIRP